MADSGVWDVESRLAAEVLVRPWVLICSRGLEGSRCRALLLGLLGSRRQGPSSSYGAEMLLSLSFWKRPSRDATGCKVIKASAVAAAVEIEAKCFVQSGPRTGGEEVTH